MNVKYRIIQYLAVIIPSVLFAYFYEPQRKEIEGTFIAPGRNVPSTKPVETAGGGNALDEISDAPAEGEPLAGTELEKIVPDAETQAGLAYVESLRQIPDAAPLIDDIVEYMKEDDGAEFSLDQLDYDENGLAVIDANTNKKMIKDPEILAKWQKLMQLIAANQAQKKADKL